MKYRRDDFLLLIHATFVLQMHSIRKVMSANPHPALMTIREANTCSRVNRTLAPIMSFPEDSDSNTLMEKCFFLWIWVRPDSKILSSTRLISGFQGRLGCNRDTVCMPLAGSFKAKPEEESASRRKTAFRPLLYMESSHSGQSPSRPWKGPVFLTPRKPHLNLARWSTVKVTLLLTCLDHFLVVLQRRPTLHHGEVPFILLKLENASKKTKLSVF